MLVGFSEDLRNVTVIAKAVSEFGILVHWHKSKTLPQSLSTSISMMMPEFLIQSR
jgi:hypothetical protein